MYLVSVWVLSKHEFLFVYDLTTKNVCLEVALNIILRLAWSIKYNLNITQKLEVL